MPCISVDKNLLFEKIGKKFTDEEFDELCFRYGIELDDICNVDGIDSYKIDIPANRYDLLCVEGLSKALKIFLNIGIPQNITVKDELKCKLYIKSDVLPYRPICLCAILRNISLTQAGLNSFIDFQDKLHQNICRKRVLVSVGTHDLDTVAAPFTYTAMKPEDIYFKTLTLNTEMNGQQIIENYKKDPNLKQFIPIIEGYPVYPVVMDSNKTILSLPPLINSFHSKLSVNTKNIFIECTATDLTKAKIVLNVIVGCFSEYCSEPFGVECVEVINPDGTSLKYPDFSDRKFTVSAGWLNKGIGLNCDRETYVTLLRKMGHNVEALETSQDLIDVIVSQTRYDVIHNYDILEDAAIAYGFNDIPKTFPSIYTVACVTMISRISDILRQEMVQLGFIEAFSFILSSTQDLINKMNIDEETLTQDSIEYPVKINSVYDVNCVRNTLIPGILRTISTNRKLPLPIKVFEVSDVVHQNRNTANKANNQRRLCAIHCGTSSGFELIHGVLDRIMQSCNIDPAFIIEKKKNFTYKLEEKDNPSFLSGRCCNVYIDDCLVGRMGIIHPNVLKNFEIHQGVCSALELYVEELSKYFKD